MTFTEYRARWIGAVLLAVLPLILSAVYLKLFSVNFAFFDEYLFERYLEKLDAGNLTWHDLFTQHNEHRIAFPLMVGLTLIKLTRWNSLAEMWLSWFLLVLSSGLLFYVFRHTHDSGATALLKFAPVVGVLHSWRQYENLLWGFQFCFYLLICFLLVALVLLDTDKKTGFRLWLAILAGTAASFSLANGLLVWPIGVLLLLAQVVFREQRSKANPPQTGWLRLGLWTASGFAVTTFYLWDYQKPSYHPDLLFSLKHPQIAAEAFLGYLGMAVATGTNQSIVAGSMILLFSSLAIYAWFRNAASPPWLPMSLLLFSLLSGGMIVLGRVGFGLGSVLLSRYVPFALLGLVGAYWLAVALPDKGTGRWLSAALSVLVVFSLLNGYLLGLQQGVYLHAQRQVLSFYAVTAPIQTEENLEKVIPPWGDRRAWLEQVRRRGFNIFRDDPNVATVDSASTLYYLDLVNGLDWNPQASPLQVTVNAKTPLTLAGWAVDAPAGAKAWGVLAELDDEKSFPTTYGLPRPDLVLAFKQRDYYYAGFNANVPLERVTPGHHTLRLKIFKLDDGKYYRTPPLVEFELKP